MYLCAWSTAASTGAPREMPGWPVIPNCARSTLSGIVFTSAPVAASYTVIVCRYIMFCANTSPVPVASTDLGEISPLIVATRVSVKSSAGLWGIVVVVAGGALVVDARRSKSSGRIRSTPSPTAGRARRDVRAGFRGAHARRRLVARGDDDTAQPRPRPRARFPRRAGSDPREEYCRSAAGLTCRRAPRCFDRKPG